MRPLFGDGAMLNLLEFEPGARVPPHDHPHEQLGYVIEGELVLDDRRRRAPARPGRAPTDPGRRRARGVVGRDACLVLDVFQPVREDYRERVSGGAG